MNTKVESNHFLSLSHKNWAENKNALIKKKDVSDNGGFWSVLPSRLEVEAAQDIFLKRISTYISPSLISPRRSTNHKITGGRGMFD